MSADACPPPDRTSPHDGLRASEDGCVTPVRQDILVEHHCTERLWPCATQLPHSAPRHPGSGMNASPVSDAQVVPLLCLQILLGFQFTRLRRAVRVVGDRQPTAPHSRTRGQWRARSLPASLAAVEDITRRRQRGLERPTA